MHAMKQSRESWATGFVGIRLDKARKHIREANKAARQGDRQLCEFFRFLAEGQLREARERLDLARSRGWLN